MTLEDYDFLISKMEEISFLDREMKTLERNISNINIQNAKHEAKIATLSEDISILKSTNEPEKYIPQKEESVLQKLTNKVDQVNSQLDDCENQLEDLNQEILILPSTFPKFVSTSNAEKQLSLMSVAELETFLKTHDLPTSGKKEELIVRLLEYECYDYWIDVSVFKKPMIYYASFVMTFFIILIFLTEYFPSIIPNLADACSAQEIEHHKSAEYCDTWHDATSLLVIPFIVGGFFFYWAIFNRDSTEQYISVEIESLRERKKDLKSQIRSLSGNLKRHKQSIKDFNTDFTANRDRAINHYSKEQKKYQSDLARIKLHEESTIQLLGLIDSNNNEVKEKLSKIHDSQTLIISALESVSHLTPRNSKV